MSFDSNAFITVAEEGQETKIYFHRMMRQRSAKYQSKDDV